MTSERSDKTWNFAAILRAVLMVAVLAAMLWVYWNFRHELKLDRLAERQQQFKSALSHSPWWVLSAAFGVYVLVTSVFIGSATAISVLYGWLFGVLLGAVVVSFASTTGATVTFLASRYLFRDVMQRRFRNAWQRIDVAFAKDGPAYLLSLRLIPGIPFFLVNALMGLTPIRLRTYWWVSQLGMLPATLVFVYAGSSVPNLAAIQERGLSSVLSARFLLALALLGLLPLALVAVKRMNWLPSDATSDQ